MKTIEPGHVPKDRWQRRFCCRLCGCVFETTDMNDWEVGNNVEMLAECPTPGCGVLVTLGDAMSPENDDLGDMYTEEKDAKASSKMVEVHKLAIEFIRDQHAATGLRAKSVAGIVLSAAHEVVACIDNSMDEFLVDGSEDD